MADDKDYDGDFWGFPAFVLWTILMLAAGFVGGLCMHGTVQEFFK